MIIWILIILLIVIPFVCGLLGKPLPFEKKHGAKPSSNDLFVDENIKSVVWDYVKHGKNRQATKLLVTECGFSVYEAMSYIKNLVDPEHSPQPVWGNQNIPVESIRSIDGMDGHQFEYFCADLLRKNEFHEVRVTSGSGDQGVDILAVKDGIRYAIQCKNYASALGNTPIQEVVAGRQFYNCHVGVVLTNSTFTPGAIKLAGATGVLLWDREKLAELMNATSPEQDSPSQDITTQDTSPLSSISSRLPMSDIAPAPQSAAKISRAAMIRPTKMSPSAKPKQIEIDDLIIEMDVDSLLHFGINLDNFGVEKDEDDNEIVLLFDVLGTGRRLPCDIEIVCNLYSASRKLLTETDLVFRDDFRKKDSLSVYFSKKNICNTATKVELFCKKM